MTHRNVRRTVVAKQLGVKAQVKKAERDPDAKPFVTDRQVEVLFVGSRAALDALMLERDSPPPSTASRSPGAGTARRT